MEEIYRQGVALSIGADWLSTDVFKIMRSAIILARHQARSSAVVNAARVLEMATMGGARALGLDKEIGSLEPGKRADLFLLNLKLPWLNPIRPQNIVSNIVYNANGSDVTDVLIDGRVVVADGRCLTVPEEQARCGSVPARSSRAEP
jgi:5-methylthioadenosine/S-adenosylhomocysteine deaminase